MSLFQSVFIVFAAAGVVRASLIASIGPAGPVPLESGRGVTVYGRPCLERSAGCLQFNVTNRGRVQVGVSGGKLRLSDLASSKLVDVTDDEGTVLLFEGRIVKRGTDDFFTVQPGWTASVELDLDDSYHLEAGVTYTVTVPRSPVPVLGAPYTFTLSAPPRSKRRVQMMHPTDMRENCTNGQKAIIDTAISNMRAALGVCYTDYFEGFECSVGPHYTLLFGAANQQRMELVRYVLYNVATANMNDTYAISCDNTDCPSSNTFAFVYQSGHIITLCDQFWLAPTALGQDSKPGTLIHELSHFNIIGQTNDYAYGFDGAKALARSDPDRATDNADNYEYFCELMPSVLTPSVCDRCDRPVAVYNECTSTPGCGYCNESGVCASGHVAQFYARSCPGTYLFDINAVSTSGAAAVGSASIWTALVVVAICIACLG